MKNIITILLLASFSTSKAQSISDYKYIVVPQKFADFEKNDYKLNAKLKGYLREKNYEIIIEGYTQKPADLQNNSCLAAKADVKNVKSTFKNKLKVVFKDCNDKIFEEYEGTSSIKEYDKGYQEALKFASQKIKTSSPKTINNNISTNTQLASNSTIQVENTVAEQKNNKESNIIITDKAKYSDGIIRIHVNKLENGDFVLLNENTIIAQFRKTLKPNIYVVTVNGIDNKSYSSTGYTTENSISFEYLDANNQWQNRVFYNVK